MSDYPPRPDPFAPRPDPFAPRQPEVLAVQQPSRGGRSGAAMLLIGALIGGVAGGFVGAGLGTRVAGPAAEPFTGLPTAPPVQGGGAVAAESAVVEVVRELGPAVVTVVQKSGNREVGSGSGFVLDASGHIATNSHVVSNPQGGAGSAFDVIFADDTRASARLVGRDPETDVAVLKVDPGGRQLKVAPLGNSDQIPVGATVVAIGSPLGEFKNSVTSGVLSGKGRRFPEESGQIFLEDLLQTDAPISPGNSGGPLIWAAAKQVVGINTVVRRDPGAEGLGFAVSSNTVRQIAEELIRTGRVERGLIGISYQQLTPRAATSIGLPSTVSGVLITQVIAGSPAVQAGLRPGDVVTKVNDQVIDAEHPLKSLMLKFRPGDRVRLTVYRDGREQVIEVTLGRQ
ncbi:MAG TPA: trypsin-like peptidase domain-containing protein [Candidatus Limnocylindria bacterium]|nr:trypsin-like peptidase domain-containing protein [Candidatus Limnocylindria bacterium]